MTKIKSIEAQQRLRLKQAAALQDREGLANLATAAATAKVAGSFVDIDFAIGLMAQASTLSPAKKEKLAEVGRAIRLDLLPTVSEDGVAVDLVARLPADVADASVVARRLVALGLRSNRRRPTANFIEFAGPSDEAAVRAVVEPVGGRVTAIVSPPAAAVAGMGTDEPGPVAGSSSTEEMMEAPPTDGAIGTGTVEPATHPDELPPDPAAPFAQQDAPGSFFSPHRLHPAPLVRSFVDTGDHRDHLDVEEVEAQARTPEAVE